jgi:hypothetical protein
MSGTAGSPPRQAGRADGKTWKEGQLDIESLYWQLVLAGTGTARHAERWVPAARPGSGGAQDGAGVLQRTLVKASRSPQRSIVRWLALPAAA